MVIKKWFKESIALLNWVEGIAHLIIASIGLWGCIALGVFDVRIMAPIIENFIFGLFSVLTGIVMLDMINGKIKSKKPDIEIAGEKYVEQFSAILTDEVLEYMRESFREGAEWALKSNNSQKD
jgi:hypothetical protein